MNRSTQTTSPVYLRCMVIWLVLVVGTLPFSSKTTARNLIIIDQKAQDKRIGQARSPERRQPPGTYTDDEKILDITIGGSLSIDCHYYDEEPRADDRLDIRRARLSFDGRAHNVIRYRLEVELQGNDPKRLTDAYGELKLSAHHALRIGQYKEPFSLEWQTKDAALFFVERSIGYYLTPGRDIGLMVHGSFFRDVLNYALGIFNGDGTDGSSRGSRIDEPEWTARLVCRPLKGSSPAWRPSFQFGGAASYSRIDLTNVHFEAKSTGMVGTKRNLYVLNGNTKFGMLQDVDERHRLAGEAGFTLGPVVLQGEYLHLKLTGLVPSGGRPQGADFSSWYGSVMFSLTDQSFTFKRGTLQPLELPGNRSLGKGGLGGFVLAFRMEKFSGDPEWINKVAFVSVEEADALSVAVNWLLNQKVRFILDYTRTDFSDPLEVRKNPDGTVDYIEDEHVLTLRVLMIL
ncbi:MAG: OprO/OprP family phosphate-selective porin [bacterium]